MKMNRILSKVLPTVGLVLLSIPAVGQYSKQGEGPLVTGQPQGISVQEIIQRFAAREKEFAQARERYTYVETVKIQTIDADGQPDGTYEQAWDINFDDRGRRYLAVTYAPAPTLWRVQMTKEDLNDVQNLMPFVLTSDDLGDYDIIYVGQQRQDELNTYVFDVAPRHVFGDRRYFQGRIWVDTRDLQIVKTYGKSVPDVRKRDNENLFPRFTTYREQVDGQYWFPTYTRADDVLHFTGNLSPESKDVHIRITIRYNNYKRFGSNSKIVFNGETLPPPAQAPAPSKPGTTQPPRP